MEKMIGTITHVFDKINVAIITLNANLKEYDKIHIKGTSTDFFQDVTSMQVNHETVKSVSSGDSIGIKMKSPVHKGDVVYLVEE